MKSVDRTIRQIIAPRMEELGFSRRHNTWNRRQFARVQVVSIQQSSYNTDTRASFTVNLGHRLGIGLGEGTWVRSIDCRPEPRRLGFLTRARADTWYHCDASDPVDIDRAVRECLGDLEGYGLPWLDGLPAAEAAHPAPLPKSPDAPPRDRTRVGSPGTPRWLRWLKRHLSSKKGPP